MTKPLPDDLDPPIVGLVRTINELPGIDTVSSCSGHEGGTGDPPDRWHVGFKLEPEGRPGAPWPTPNAWLSLEFLAWLINGELRRTTGIELELNAAPPFLNHPGNTIYFMINGIRGEYGMEPDEFAAKVRELTEEYYITAELAASWNDDEEDDASASVQ